MIQKQQKALLHIYKHAADLSEPAYRSVVSHASGGLCNSAADRDFSQQHFERAMAELETLLFSRVHTGVVDNPIGRNKYIHKEFHWRNKLPEYGKINSRQFRKINELWEKICPYLSADQRNPRYFAGIVYHATSKRDLIISALTFNEASMVIDALRDRLSYAIRKPKHDEVPF